MTTTAIDNVRRTMLAAIGRNDWNLAHECATYLKRAGFPVDEPTAPELVERAVPVKAEHRGR